MNGESLHLSCIEEGANGGRGGQMGVVDGELNPSFGYCGRQYP